MDLVEGERSELGRTGKSARDKGRTPACADALSSLAFGAAGMAGPEQIALRVVFGNENIRESVTDQRLTIELGRAVKVSRDDRVARCVHANVVPPVFARTARLHGPEHAAGTVYLDQENIITP